MLKVGSSQEKVTAKPDTQSSTSRPSVNVDKMKSKDHSSKKKKKKRSASRERKKPKFDPRSSVSNNHRCLFDILHVLTVEPLLIQPPLGHGNLVILTGQGHIMVQHALNMYMYCT